MSERDFEGFDPETAVVEEIVTLGKSMGLEVDEGDVNELVEEHSEELTTEELKDAAAYGGFAGNWYRGGARGRGGYLYK